MRLQYSPSRSLRCQACLAALHAKLRRETSRSNARWCIPKKRPANCYGAGNVCTALGRTSFVYALTTNPTTTISPCNVCGLYNPRILSLLTPCDARRSDIRALEHAPTTRTSPVGTSAPTSTYNKRRGVSDNVPCDVCSLTNSDHMSYSRCVKAKTGECAISPTATLSPIAPRPRACARWMRVLIERLPGSRWRYFSSRLTQLPRCMCSARC